uniref:Rx N-terminal domain-containing protein n=1 Tax=Fagus sylvatica TaxID=28930 RepID=A0A2N9FIK0_FAGSY
MTNVKDVLLDAEQKQTEKEGLRDWLAELKDVFHDFIDVLDEFDCEDLRRQVVKTHGSTGKKVRRFFSSSNPLAFRFKMGHRIKEIREKLEGLAKVRDDFHLEKRLDDKHIVHREMTHSFVPDSDVMGRADDKKNIIDLLMHPSNDGNVSVISIVGIGGMGKTTLAQWVYNDERVVQLGENMSMDLVRSYLRRSKIVVTTRSHKVAKVMATMPIYDLKGLPDDVSLSLFLRWAFNKKEEEKQYPKLVEIGKEIVKKCSGVPLAVTTLGSLLYSKTEEHDWIDIRDDEIWKLEQKEDDILPALRLNLRLSTLEALPSSIGTLKHLRHLNLQWNLHIKKLPNSICDLQNLETLLLNGCAELEELPRDIRKMCPGLESFPEGIQRLTALRRLGFSYCESLISLPQGLKHLTALERLEIWECEKINLTEGEDYPTRLRIFRIGFFPKLVDLPQWLIQSATTLQFLEIGGCVNLAALPEWLPNLTSLQKLQIWGCRKLSSLPEGMGRLTALRGTDDDTLR